MTTWKRALALGATAVLAAACSSTGGTASSAPSAAPSAAAPSAAGSEAPSQPAELTKVRVQLKWVAQAQFAGYYAAVDQGYYAAQGLDVQILLGGPDIDPVRVVASDGAEFGTTWVPAMLAAREGGADVVDISQVFQRSGTLEVSFKDKNITKPEDLKNKKVGSWLGGNEPELFAALNKVEPQSRRQIARRDHQAGLRHVGPAWRQPRCGAGDDLQRVRTGPRGEEPRNRQPLPGRRPERHLVQRCRHRHAPGRDLCARVVPGEAR